MTLDRVRAAIKRVADTPGESEYSADVCQTTVNGDWQRAVLDALQTIADEVAALSGEGAAPTTGDGIREWLEYAWNDGYTFGRQAIRGSAIGVGSPEMAATRTMERTVAAILQRMAQDGEGAAQPPEVQSDLPEWLETINEVATGIRAYIGSTAGVPEHILSEWGTWLQDAVERAKSYAQGASAQQEQAPMVQVPAPPPEALLFLRGEIKVWRDLAQAYAEEAEAAGSTLRRWMALYYAWLADYAEAALSGQAPSRQGRVEDNDHAKASTITVPVVIRPGPGGYVAEVRAPYGGILAQPGATPEVARTALEQWFREAQQAEDWLPDAARQETGEPQGQGEGRE